MKNKFKSVTNEEATRDFTFSHKFRKLFRVLINLIHELSTSRLSSSSVRLPADLMGGFSLLHNDSVDSGDGSENS